MNASSLSNIFTSLLINALVIFHGPACYLVPQHVCRWPCYVTHTSKHPARHETGTTQTLRQDSLVHHCNH